MIKNIIFDFGDIFINLDKEATFKALFDLGVTQVSEETMKVYQHYEMGLLSTTEFLAFFEEKFKIPSQQLIKAWNAILLDFPIHRFQFIQELSNNSKYRLFLLSNTNDLHISWIQQDWGMLHYQDFKKCFEHFYLSHEMKMRKPNVNIFEYVLEAHDLVPQETLFVDDTKENTEAASLLGIQVWNLIPGKDDVTQLFDLKYFSY
jgi:glucose-1-phosphatase